MSKNPHNRVLVSTGVEIALPSNSAFPYELKHANLGTNLLNTAISQRHKQLPTSITSSLELMQAKDLFKLIRQLDFQAVVVVCTCTSMFSV